MDRNLPMRCTPIVKEQAVTPQTSLNSKNNNDKKHKHLQRTKSSTLPTIPQARTLSSHQTTLSRNTPSHKCTTSPQPLPSWTFQRIFSVCQSSNFLSFLTQPNAGKQLTSSRIITTTESAHLYMLTFSTRERGLHVHDALLQGV